MIPRKPKILGYRTGRCRRRTRKRCHRQRRRRRSSAPPPAAHDAAASGADWLSGAPAQPALQPARSVPQSTGAVRCPGYARHRLAGAALPPAVPGYPRAGGHDPERLPAIAAGHAGADRHFGVLAARRQVSGLGMGAATLLSWSPSAPSVPGRRRWSRWRWC